MMKIDSHQHFWNYSPTEYDWIDDQMSVIRRDFLPEHLSKELISNNIHGSVSVQARQSLEETEWLLKLADAAGIIKGVVGWLDLRSPQVENQLIKYAEHPKFVGVRHVVQGEPEDDFILGKEFNQGVSLLAKYDLTYDILVFPRQLPYAVEFVKRHPDITFILDHIAKPFIKHGIISPWKDHIRELSAFSNVYCKVSGMVTEADWYHWKPEDFKPYLDVIFNSFGTDRVMFGSDWPVCLVAGNYSQVLSVLTSYIESLSITEKDKVLGGNAVKAYKLKI
jgi:L-fuconolactonase